MEAVGFIESLAAPAAKRRWSDEAVIPPFLMGCLRRMHAAIFSFWAGVMPPMPHCPAMVCLQTE